MVSRLHHINFLVRDLDRAIPVYERVLGRAVARRDELAERGVRTAGFDVGGVWIVLVQPVREGTLPARHLAKHGEGFFLLSLEVASLADEIGRLGDAAFSGPPRAGIADWRVVDLDHGATFGAQLQLCEPGGTGQHG